MQIQEYTVTQISNQIKQLVESSYGYVRVRGEISGLKIAASGHGYFNLKDENAILSVTCWRHVLAKLKAKPSDGLEVIATGKITTYMGQSRYQLSVEYIEHAGVGALMQVLAERKAKLQAEGLFDSSRKKPLPFFPKIIGVVTSISGAVIQDIIHRVEDRCPTRILIWPVTVQGENAADEITAAIRGFNSLPSQMRPDVLIVARGGGSIEDLWCFNEEVVVRAVAESELPIISAVGHETDFTLTDFAADMRAPTPTAAAEFATPIIADLKYTISSNFTRILAVLRNKIQHLGRITNAYDSVILKPTSFMMRWEQKIDELGFALSGALSKLLSMQAIKLKQYRSEAINPSQIIKLKSLQVESLGGGLPRSMLGFSAKLAAELSGLSSLLSSLDYNKVLQRGFAVLQSSSGATLSSISQLPSGEEIKIKLSDGSKQAVIK
ncbi:MAG: exodeoxyribonuclease VII large subunit [Pseudomonadota bacterium]